MWNIWIRELFINLSILITLIFIGSQFFMGNGKKLTALDKDLGLGILGGVFGIILMNFTIVIPPEGVFIDMRNIAILITSLYGGAISTLIATSMLSIFRWIHGGMTKTAFMGVASIILVGVFSIIISKEGLKKDIKWIYIFIISSISNNLFLAITISDKSVLVTIVFLHTITFFIANIIVYILIVQLERNFYLIRGLEKETTEDFLTGLRNARSFDDIFNKTIEEVKAGKEEKLSLLMIDIDHFKRVNDNYGHLVGDLVLSDLGKLLKESVRETDIVARVGGEEFCIILKFPSVNFTLEIAERIRSSVEVHKFYIDKNKSINITVSIGAAIYPDLISDLETIKDISDKNLYKAKSAGRNRTIS